jgi:hypothetical protein
MIIIRSARAKEDAVDGSDGLPADPLHAEAVRIFAEEQGAARSLGPTALIAWARMRARTPSRQHNIRESMNCAQSLPGTYI